MYAARIPCVFGGALCLVAGFIHVRRAQRNMGLHYFHTVNGAAAGCGQNGAEQNKAKQTFYHIPTEDNDLEWFSSAFFKFAKD